MSRARGYNHGVKPKSSDSPRTGGDGQVRLHKALATAGLASRRACEDLIARGAVAVNGQTVVQSPVWVNPERDRVTIDGRTVRLRPDRLVYVMLYKPRNTVTTLEDPDGRRTVADLVEHPSGERLYPVGRLDYDTMGLVLMTNDGELANRLTHPKFEVHKTYRAVVKGALDDESLERLRKGFFLADRREGRTDGATKTSGAMIEVVRREPTRTLIDITLREGRNRQVRRMLAKVGCPVKKLVRIQMGPLTLKGVPLGSWRELTIGEINALKRAASGGGKDGGVGDTRARRPRVKSPKPGARSGPSAAAGAAPKKRASAGGNTENRREKRSESAPANKAGGSRAKKSDAATTKKAAKARPRKTDSAPAKKATAGGRGKSANTSSAKKTGPSKPRRRSS